jgi:PAS domain S-box-containing protein
LSRGGDLNEVLFLDSGGLPCSVDPELPMPIRGMREQAYRTGTAVYNNDFMQSTWVQFMPEGHVRLDNVLFAPLIIEGTSVGVIGLANKAGGFCDHDARMASAFGEFAAIALHNSLTLEALHRSEERFRTMAEHIQDGLTILEHERVVYFNNRLCEIFGYDRTELMQMNPFVLIAPEDRQRMEQVYAAYQQSGIVPEELEFAIVRKDGTKRFIRNRYSLSYKGSEIFARYIVTTDITEHKQYENHIKESLREKEVLLQEVYHRTKNNMQVIHSLLSLQSNSLQDPGLLKAFRDTQDRIRAMALVHEKLYRSESLSQIDLGDYLKDLAETLVANYQTPDKRIFLEVNAAAIHVSLDTAIPCSLVMNELISNCIKHAFPQAGDGRIIISLRSKDGLIELSVRDDGVGVANGFDPRAAKTLGLPLVINLIEHQLKGSISLDTTGGTAFRILFQDRKRP